MPPRKDPDLSENLDPVLSDAYKAEAEKLRAEADFFKSGKTDFTASAARHRAEARYLTAAAQLDEIEVRKWERHESLRNAGRYFFTQEVDEDSIKKCMKRLDQWDYDDSACDVEVVFTSPGGSCIDGFALWDYLMEYRNRGHHLTTHTLGMAASMAGVLLQAGDVRKMGAESFLLIHEIAIDRIEGKIGVVEDDFILMKKLQDRFFDILSRRSTLDIEEIRIRALRRDWWLNSEEALELGFVDEVV